MADNETTYVPLKWDQPGERFYETGVDQVALYPQVDGAYPKGYAWNGVTAINENPSGAESNKKYADNIEYLNLISKEQFGATIEAYTYPPEFEECDGSALVAPGVTIGQQNRKPFGLAYRSKIGNDEDGDSHGYKLHLVWGASASPSAKNRETINETPDGIVFSWELSTISAPVSKIGDKVFKPTAHMVIDSRTADSDCLAALEAILYGSTTADAYLPLPDAVISTMAPTPPGP